MDNLEKLDTVWDEIDKVYEENEKEFESYRLARADHQGKMDDTIRKALKKYLDGNRKRLGRLERLYGQVITLED